MIKNYVKLAQSFKPKNRRFSVPKNGELELAIAYLKNEVTFTQLCLALGMPTSGNGGYRTIVKGVKEAFDKGKIITK